MTNFLVLLQTVVLPVFDGAIENTFGISSQFLHDLTSGIMRRVDPVRHWHSSSSLRSDFVKKKTHSYTKAAAYWSKSRKCSAHTTEPL